MSPPPPPPHQIAADMLAEAIEADVFLYSAGIFQANSDMLIRAIQSIKHKRPNAALILTTNGGSADSAFQMTRCLTRNYKKITLYVLGDCKSAGTLVAVAADEIVMSDFGQFGPLDVQLADKEELLGQMPALEVSQTLTTLSQTAFNFFNSHFYEMEPGRGMSTKTAAEIALKLTNSIIEPIASQIDPLLLGRVERSMRVAEAYSQRLNPNFKHIKKLVSDYPSHEFVIDFEEAAKIFANVRRINQMESELEEELRGVGLIPHPALYIFTLSSALKSPFQPKANENPPQAIPASTTIHDTGANELPSSQPPKPRKQSAGRDDQATVTS